MTSGVIGVVLAGGRSSRMGGVDKALMPFGNGTLAGAVIARLKPQVDEIVVNRHGFAAHLDPILPHIRDLDDGFAGPLAGILAGMTWTRANRPDVSAIVTVACDTPFFPSNLVHQFLAAARDSGSASPAVTGAAEDDDPSLAPALVPPPSRIVLAASNGRTHPVFGLWPVALRDALQAALAAGERKVEAWAVKHGAVTAPFPMIRAGDEMADPFFNINLPEDIQNANRIRTLIG